jgi:hypothetical protein
MIDYLLFQMPKTFITLLAILYVYLLFDVLKYIFLFSYCFILYLSHQNWSDFGPVFLLQILQSIFIELDQLSYFPNLIRHIFLGEIACVQKHYNTMIARSRHSCNF